MRILHLSVSDVSGGAAIAAYRLHTGLRSLGQDSSMFVTRRDTGDPDVRVYQPPPPPVDFRTRNRRYIDRHLELFRQLIRPRGKKFSPFDIRHYEKRRPHGVGLFSDSECGLPSAQVLSQMPPSDILHLHWINRFIDLETFFPTVLKTHSAVWTLHDMNAFTGGCHYDGGCGRFKRQCGKCPNLGSGEEQDLSWRIWNIKKDIYSLIDSSQLHLVTPSQWLAAECRGSTLLEKFPVTVIPNGLDLEVFKPRNKSFCRNTLGLPNDSNVILFVAHLIDEERKGFSILLEALQNLTGLPGIHFLSVGQKVPKVSIPIPHTHVGHVHNERILSLVYSAADVFAFPSLQDNLPNTVMEALACGLPVVAFEVGGVPELVKNGVDGILAPPGIPSAFASTISTLISDDQLRKKMAKNARRKAERRFKSDACADSYLELYQRLLS